MFILKQPLPINSTSAGKVVKRRETCLVLRVFFFFLSKQFYSFIFHRFIDHFKHIVTLNLILYWWNFSCNSWACFGFFSASKKFSSQRSDDIFWVYNWLEEEKKEQDIGVNGTCPGGHFKLWLPWISCYFIIIIEIFICS